MTWLTCVVSFAIRNMPEACAVFVSAAVLYQFNKTLFLQKCQCLHMNGIFFSIPQPLCANAFKCESRKISFSRTRKRHKIFCIHKITFLHRAFSVKQLDAAQGEEQLNLAHHETEKSQGLVQLGFKTVLAHSITPPPPTPPSQKIIFELSTV